MKSDNDRLNERMEDYWDFLQERKAVYRMDPTVKRLNRRRQVGYWVLLVGISGILGPLYLIALFGWNMDVGFIALMSHSAGKTLWVGAAIIMFPVSAIVTTRPGALWTDMALKDMEKEDPPANNRLM